MEDYQVFRIPADRIVSYRIRLILTAMFFFFSIYLFVLGIFRFAIGLEPVIKHIKIYFPTLVAIYIVQYFFDQSHKMRYCISRNSFIQYIDEYNLEGLDRAAMEKNINKPNRRKIKIFDFDKIEKIKIKRNKIIIFQDRPYLWSKRMIVPSQISNFSKFKQFVTENFKGKS